MRALPHPALERVCGRAFPGSVPAIAQKPTQRERMRRSGAGELSQSCSRRAPRMAANPSRGAARLPAGPLWPQCRSGSCPQPRLRSLLHSPVLSRRSLRPPPLVPRLRRSCLDSALATGRSPMLRSSRHSLDWRSSLWCSRIGARPRGSRRVLYRRSETCLSSKLDPPRMFGKLGWNRIVGVL